MIVTEAYKEIEVSNYLGFKITTLVKNIELRNDIDIFKDVAFKVYNQNNKLILTTHKDNDNLEFVYNQIKKL